jgi:hypothetical protein
MHGIMPSEAPKPVDFCIVLPYNVRALIFIVVYLDRIQT